ncbi:MAG: secretin N-terminal domain-containing protein [Planctomycetota bacterium]
MSYPTLRLAIIIWAVLLAPTVAFAKQNDPAANDATEGAASEEEDLVQLSFSGASIDVVTQWLAEVTRKSLIKHKDVSCSLTIMSPQKLPRREAISLVYDALALEGYTAVENHTVVYIVPEDKATKVSPEMMNGTSDTLAGRQIGVRFFELRHTKASSVRDKLKAILSKTGTFEIDERANKVFVKDFVDNVRLVAELLDQIDIPTEADSVTEVISLRHTQADQIATILSAVFAGAKPTAKKPTNNRKKPQAKKPTAAGASVIILPDSVSNRIIITAPAEQMGEIRSLIKTLDTEKPADVAVRVIPLAHVDANELVREVGSMYRKIRGSAAKDTIEIAANERSNSLIVLSSKSNYDQIAELVQSLDTEDAQTKATRTFTLTHADAEEIADQLEELFEDPGSNNYWGGWNRRNSRGNQGKVRFVANRRRNEVIAIGSPAILERVAETLEMLDEPVDKEFLAPRIFQLKFVAADDIKEVLDELFTKKEDDRPYWYDGDTTDENDVGRLYGKVRFATEPYSNSIIVTTNSSENFEVVRGILDRLDTQFPDREATFSVPLNHAKAITVANNLNILFARQGAPSFRRQPGNRNNNNRNNNNRNNNNPNTSEGFELEEDDEEDSFYPWLGGQGGNNNRGRNNRPTRTVSDLIGKVRIVPDQRTNSLMVTTAPHFIHQVRQVVATLDVPTAQVLIEAKIIEVSLDDRLRMGIRWGPNPLNLDPDDLDNSVLGMGTAINRETYIGSMMADALREGTVSSSIQLDALVQFLRKNTASRVRAEPRLNVADNERGKLFVGSRIPFISNTITSNEGSQNVSFDYQDVGIILEVTPNINANDEVALKIRVEASQIRPGETLFGGAIVDTRNYKTELTVKNGEVLVLGGIIQREQSDVVRKIPILGDIPLLGALFRKKDTVDREVELMVFLRPSVTRSPEEVRELMERERTKIRNIEAWERELEAERRERAREDAEAAAEAEDR